MDQTAFDALVDKLKKDLNDEKAAQGGSEHVSKLQSIFNAALNEMGAKSGGVAERLHDESQKMKAQMAAHSAATVSSAFAVGYLVGKAIAGKVRK